MVISSEAVVPGLTSCCDDHTVPEKCGLLLLGFACFCFCALCSIRKAAMVCLWCVFANAPDLHICFHVESIRSELSSSLSGLQTLSGFSGL